MLDALFLIAKERERQIVEECFGPGHDDYHEHGELALAAACYAIPPDTHNFATIRAELWPWDEEWYKPKGRVRDLVRAGALILAELDRIQREESDNLMSEFTEGELSIDQQWRKDLVIGWRKESDAITQGEYWVRWTSPGGLYYWLHPTENRWVGEPEQKTMPTFPSRQAAEIAVNNCEIPNPDETGT